MERREFLAAGAAVGIGPVLGVRAGRREQASLQPRASVDLPNALDFDLNEDGSLAYVGGRDRFAVVDVSDPTDPAVVAERRDLLAEREEGPLVFSRDVGVDGDRVVVCGWQWANADRGAAFVLYDVSDPAAPEQVAVHPTDYRVHNIALSGSTAYLVTATSEERGVAVVDVSDDEPRELARWSVVDANPAWADVPVGIRRSHDLYVRDGRLYVAYWDAGTRILDVSDPADPTPIATAGGRSPEAVAEAAAERGTPDGPLRVETRELPGNVTAVRPSTDGSLLAASQEAWDVPETDAIRGPGGIQLWGVSGVGDGRDPRKVTTLSAPVDVIEARSAEGIPATRHNAKNFGWRGSRLYSGWNASGVRVFDLDVPSRPREVARWSRPDTTIHTVRPLPDGFAALDNDVDGGGGEAGLFTFPEPSGEGRPAPTGSPVTGVTTPAEGTAARGDGTPRTGTSPGGDPTRNGTPPTATRSPRATGPTVSTPGVGVVGSLTAGAVVAWRLLARRDREQP